MGFLEFIVLSLHLLQFRVYVFVLFDLVVDNELLLNAELLVLLLDCGYFLGLLLLNEPDFA